MPEYVGTKVKAEEWKVNQATISKWCREGKVPGAKQDAQGSPWRIPADLKKPKTN